MCSARKSLRAGLMATGGDADVDKDCGMACPERSIPTAHHQLQDEFDDYA
jgi:hypothetical protein